MITTLLLSTFFLAWIDTCYFITHHPCLINSPTQFYNSLWNIARYWLRFNIFVPILNFFVDLLSLGVTFRLFARSVCSRKIISRAGFLLTDIVVALALFIVNVWLSAVLLASARAISLPVLNEAAIFFMVAGLSGFGIDSAALDLSSYWGLVASYLLMPLIAGVGWLGGRFGDVGLTHPIFLGCGLMSITSIVPTLLHIGLIVASIAVKPILIAVAGLSRQAERIFHESVDRFAILLMGITKIIVFFVIFALRSLLHGQCWHRSW